MFNKPETPKSDPLPTLKDYLADHLRKLAYDSTLPKKVFIGMAGVADLQDFLRGYVPAIVVEYDSRYQNGNYAIEYYRGTQVYVVEGRYVEGQTARR